LIGLEWILIWHNFVDEGNLVLYLKIRDYEVIEYNSGYLVWLECISYRLILLDIIFCIKCLYLKKN
jgi:hypothetical protein